MTRRKREWRRHPQHGHMLRGAPTEGWCYVITSLLQHNLETERDPEAWQNQALRLRVNAGCGQLAADEMKETDVNPDFRKIRESSVPAHIRAAFLAVLGEE